MGAAINKATTIFDTLRNSMQHNGIKYVYFLQTNFSRHPKQGREISKEKSKGKMSRMQCSQDALWDALGILSGCSQDALWILWGYITHPSLYLWITPSYPPRLPIRVPIAAHSLPFGALCLPAYA
jgi:hypothetical protein